MGGGEHLPALKKGGSEKSEEAEEEGKAVAGVLYKWVNYGKGWRSRWFVLDEGGVLCYYKIHGPDKVPVGPRVIGENSLRYINKFNSTRSGSNSRLVGPAFGEIHLKVVVVFLSFVSKKDNKPEPECECGNFVISMNLFLYRKCREYMFLNDKQIFLAEPTSYY